jgi:amidase
MTSHQWDDLDVLATAAAVRSGRLTARAAAEAALDRIARLDPGLNAVQQVRADQALREADALDAGGPGHDGALAGVPVMIKAETDVAGLVTTYGGRGNSTPAPADAELVRRLRSAGAVVVATTTMPEFGQFPFTEGASWGQTRNPWNPDHSPGGSSGGSAVAVASGMVPLATGGDGGGSIRIPASCCGLVGLKPMRGRVSCAPRDVLWGTLGTLGPLTRTVADTALVYDVIAGALASDRYAAPAPTEPFLDRVQRDPAPLRIGWLTRPSVPGLPVDPQVRAAVERTAARLADAGHAVRRLDGRWPDVTASFVPQFYAALWESTQQVEHPERLERRTLHTAAIGRRLPAPVLAAAVRAGHRLRERIAEQFADCDLVLTPTLACLPPPLGRLDAAGSVRGQLRSMPMIAFTVLANVTGYPAISVPAGRSSEATGGLPIGVQLVAPRADEGVLLSVAAQLERLG